MTLHQLSHPMMTTEDRGQPKPKPKAMTDEQMAAFMAQRQAQVEAEAEPLAPVVPLQPAAPVVPTTEETMTNLMAKPTAAKVRLRAPSVVQAKDIRGAGGKPGMGGKGDAFAHM